MPRGITPQPEILRGGLINLERVRRVGPVVERYQDHPWPDSVSDALLRLRERGFTGCPVEVARFDKNSVALTYIEGQALPCPLPKWASSNPLLRRVTGFVGRFSLAAEGIVDPDSASWFTPRLTGDVLVHGDPHPTNIVLDTHRRPVGLIDFELATTGSHLSNLASLLFTWAPLEPPPLTCWSSCVGISPPDRARVILAGWPTPVSTGDLLEAFAEFIEWRLSWIHDLAELGNAAATQFDRDHTVKENYQQAKKLLRDTLSG